MAYHAKMEGEKLSPGTMKNYVTTEDYVKRFIKSEFGKEDLFHVCSSGTRIDKCFMWFFVTKGDNLVVQINPLYCPLYTPSLYRLDVTFDR